jgi:hypothetical protein
MLTKVIMTAASGKAGCGRLSCVLGFAGEAGACSFAVVQRGLVAMMAVGDDELLVGHRGGQQADGRRVADRHRVQDAVLIGDFGFGGAVAVVENLLHAAGGVGVEHEDLAEVRVGGLQQVKPVALGLGEGLLVAEDDLLGVVVELAESDEAAALLHDALGG